MIATVRAGGIATIVVNKTVASVLSVIDRSTVLIKGTVLYDDFSATLRADAALMQCCLGV